MKTKDFFLQMFDQGRRFVEKLEVISSLNLQLALLDDADVDEETAAELAKFSNESHNMAELELGLDMMQELYQTKIPLFWLEMFLDPKKKAFLQQVCDKKGLDIEDAELLLLDKMRLEYEANPSLYDQAFEEIDRLKG